jgi:hypothetical protein
VSGVASAIAIITLLLATRIQRIVADATLGSNAYTLQPVDRLGRRRRRAAVWRSITSVICRRPSSPGWVEGS